ncbi:MAG: alpha/beta hydrolase, partial [Oscillospiraceae bacterium]|nr:alpha/beta hydrolase [Oscillospiraceae bacterium]
MKKYTVEKRWIPAPSGRMKLLILRPTVTKASPERTPGILWIHGGGYATGMAGMIYMSRAIGLVK